VRSKAGIWGATTPRATFSGRCRTGCWPAHEVAALNAARIAGKPDADIRALVLTLEAARKAVA